MFKSLLLIPVMLFCQPLLADVVITKDEHRFEGVATEFAEDGQLVLSTGYGDLTFDVQSEVSDAAATNYQWPTTKDDDLPPRSKAFKEWVDRLEAQKQQAQTWREISKAKDAAEVSFSALEDKRESYHEMKTDGTSVKDRRAAREKLNESSEYAYIAVAVDRVSVLNDGSLTVQCDRHLYNPRTGKQLDTDVTFNSQAIHAAKGLTADDVDKRNDTWAEDVRENSRRYYQERRWIDYDRAEELERDDLVVLKVWLHVDDNENTIYLSVPVRLKTGKVKDD